MASKLVKKSKQAQKRKPNIPIGPLKAQVTEVYSDDLRKNVEANLDLPQRVIELIFDTTYELPSGIKVPLFPHGGNEFHLTEIQEIIHVYDIFRGLHTDTGRELDIVKSNKVKLDENGVPIDPAENDPEGEIISIDTITNTPNTGLRASEKRTVLISEQEAIKKFENHIRILVAIRENKTKKNLVITDDTVFDSPAFASLAQEEKLKIQLLTRKKKPVKGIKCDRCPNDVAFVEDKQLRSGDEGSTVFYQCSVCDHEWTKN